MELGEDFFDQYESVTIEFKMQDGTLRLTLTENATLPDWVEYKDGQYKIVGIENINYALLVKLTKI